MRKSFARSDSVGRSRTFLILSPTLSVFGASSAVGSGGEVVKDSKDIFGQFSGVGFFSTTRGSENCDLSIVEGADGFEEFESVSTEPVFMGNHNLLDRTLANPFQNSRKSFPSVVEPASNVADDLFTGTRSFDIFDLAFEVVFLLMRGDSGISDNVSNTFRGIEEQLEVTHSIESFSTWHRD